VYTELLGDGVTGAADEAIGSPVGEADAEDVVVGPSGPAGRLPELVQAVRAV